MAGCSIVFLTIVMLPALMVVSLVGLVVLAAAEFVMSPAFPCLVVSVLCSTLAFVDLVRILWRHHREGDAFPLERGLLVRPLVLFGVAFVLFVAMLALSGAMLYAWYQGLATAA